jgi:hypothetical protein
MSGGRSFRRFGTCKESLESREGIEAFRHRFGVVERSTFELDPGVTLERVTPADSKLEIGIDTAKPEEPEQGQRATQAIALHGSVARRNLDEPGGMQIQSMPGSGCLDPGPKSLQSRTG